MERYFIIDTATYKIVMENIMACNSYNALCIYNNLDWPVFLHPDTDRYTAVKQKD